MRSLLLVVLTTLFFSGELAFAYAGDLYGHGIWGGAQNCGYGTQASKVHYMKDSKYLRIQEKIDKIKEELKNKEERKDALDEDINGDFHKKSAEVFLKEWVREFVVKHVVEGKNRENYVAGLDDNPESPATPACSDNNPGNIPKEFCSKGVSDGWTNGMLQDNYIDGHLSTDICSNTAKIDRADSEACKEWLLGFMNDASEYRGLDYDILKLKRELEILEKQKSDEKKRIKKQVKKGEWEPDVDEDDDEETEAKNCVSCWISKHSDTIRLVAGIGMPILGAYLGYKGAQNISEQNARLGWPTSPYIAAGFSYPFIMQGLYGGIMGGMAAGGYGCSGGYYGGAMGPYGMHGAGGLFGTGLYGGIGGAFGYPGGMYGAGPWGAGPYMPGMGPWGMGGPFINGGFPGGFAMGGAIGGAFGLATGGFPYAGGYPIAGYPYGGAAVGGAIGGGLAMGGYPYGGAFGGAIGGGLAMGGYPYGGAMGMPPFSNMMGGYAMGLPMGGIAMGGAMGGGLAMGGAMGGIGMQQQYMQQYMQMLQQQMSYQQEQMQKQQVIGRLTQELYKIQLQIQQISSGSYYGGQMNFSVSPNLGMPGYNNGGVATTPNSGGSIIRNQR
ncbi:MAG: hypothetical protein KDD58_00515 [Bdellovibrionales bacterium]|nr:hypothetical protein [Bdellovibrionales bacterium]